MKKLKNIIKNIKVKLSKDEKIINLYKDIHPNVTCYDIGASYYPHPQWELFRRSKTTNWIAIEPNSENLNYIKNWRWPCSVSAVTDAVSQNGGKIKFYKTNIDSGSSILKPIVANHMAHRCSNDYFFPIEEKYISSVKINEIFEKYLSNNSALIKLDTQGSELSLIQGVDHELFKNSVLCVELESTLLASPVYENSSRFSDVLMFMEQIGFELVSLKPIPISINKNYKSPKLSIMGECDAVFMIRPDILQARDINAKLVMLGCYLAYKIYGEALFLIDGLIEMEKNKLSNNEFLKLNDIKNILLKCSH